MSAVRHVAARGLDGLTGWRGWTAHLLSVLLHIGFRLLEDDLAVGLRLGLGLGDASCLSRGPLLVALPLLEQRFWHRCGRHGCDKGEKRAWLLL